jgi:aspartate aminotransferase
MQQIVKNLQGVSIEVAGYQSKRDALFNGLTEIGYEVVKPGGAFYMFPKSPVEDDVVFTNELRRHNVLVVPGRGFGSPGHFRIAYCTDDLTIQNSLEGFQAAFLSAKHI